MTAGTPRSRDPIGNALAGLPRARASAGFTDRLAARWAGEAPLRRRRRRVRRALATTASLLLLVVVALGLQQREERREARFRRDALQQRHEELRRELAALRERAASQPTLYLGATDEFDVVLDLGPWMEPGPQPAAYAVSRP